MKSGWLLEAVMAGLGSSLEPLEPWRYGNGRLRSVHAGIAFACFIVIHALPCIHGFPEYQLATKSSLDEGRELSAALTAAAASESLLDRLLGTDCFSRAVAELEAGCRGLAPEAKARLALRLVQCQAAALERQEQLRDGQEAMLHSVHRGRELLDSVLTGAEARARAAEAMQEEAAAAQRRLTADLGAVAASSEGLRSLVEALLSYQHRSEALVLRMLGHETGQGNAWHLLALIAGVWVVGGFLGGAARPHPGHRALLAHLAPYLQLGEGGTVRRGPAPGAVRNAEPVYLGAPAWLSWVVPRALLLDLRVASRVCWLGAAALKLARGARGRSAAAPLAELERTVLKLIDQPRFNGHV
ncbi:hypothetical protein APUTEX25_003307 [Auxenochlorella protothecoides]|uniref:Uncharacterized protein n=1 Tax=Auxenochlorella protothecoides TaxID=3075 RepID=A0A3M7KUT7_AUXPR|nr:hypothetical protein APUTEX25_003307 [Auxenochlorella protothecoides]|eukprot:RMZ53485.1 hypothetical protein APUTEX25_003307 [Auxenochlorella protothecoides]